MKLNDLVSIIIPTRNSEQRIAACLKSIKKQTYKNIETIVVDNNSTDKTQNIAHKYTSFVFNKGPERSAQRNFGAKKSHGKYVFFIDSDMQLDKKVVQQCVEQYQNNKDSIAVVIPEESYGNGFWAECKKLERSFYLGVDFMESARFFRKDVFKKMHGYDEKNTGTEDYDLPQRIKRSFSEKSISRVHAFIYHNEGSLSLLKTLSKKFYYAKKMGSYIKVKENRKYFYKQASILERYKLYFIQPKKLFRNPRVGIGMLFMKTAEMTVSVLGYISSKI